MPSALTCPQCGHENELQRIYCHECGAKLDRSVLPPEPPREATYKEQVKRIQKIARPASGFFIGWHKSLLNSLGSALLVAWIVLIIMPPADAPEMADKDKILDAPQVGLALENVVYGNVRKNLALDEDTINLYLQGAIRAKPTGIIGDEYLFLRAYVKLDDGGLRIYAHQTIYGFPLYAGLAFQLPVKDGKLDPVNTGGWIGRLPIHPLITQYAGYVFDNLWSALKRDHDTFRKVQGIEISQGKLTITAGGQPL
jgi:hypothetical protein